MLLFWGENIYLNIHNFFLKVCFHLFSVCSQYFWPIGPQTPNTINTSVNHEDIAEIRIQNNPRK